MNKTVILNTLQWPRREVINKSSGDEPDYDLVVAPEFGYKEIESVTPDAEVTIGKRFYKFSNKFYSIYKSLFHRTRWNYFYIEKFLN